MSGNLDDGVFAIVVRPCEIASEKFPFKEKKISGRKLSEASWMLISRGDNLSTSATSAWPE